MPPVGGGAELPAPPQAETSTVTIRAASARRREERSMKKPPRRSRPLILQVLAKAEPSVGILYVEVIANTLIAGGFEGFQSRLQEATGAVAGNAAVEAVAQALNHSGVFVD